MTRLSTQARWRSATDGNAPQGQISHGHVGAAQLGTCDEAGGGPTTPQHLKFARPNEAASERVRDAARAAAEQHRGVSALYGAILAIGGALTAGIWALP